ncbi:MAG: lysophospholipid acyltransferase family protein [Armatimonadota bacterium]
MSQAFFPPKNKPLLTAIAGKLFLPLLLRFWDKIVRVEVDDEGRRALEALRGARVALCPNHPNRCDSDVLFAFSTLMNEQWNYLAAREVFDPPLQGWLLQSLGVYSVLRGTMDSESFRMTRRLLVEGKRRLVLFPEGETYGQNDTLMPFEPGIAQFGFWALEDLAARQPNEPLPPVYLVPITLRYLFLRDMRPTIERSLGRLERTLGISAERPDDPYERLRNIGETVLKASEQEYSVQPPADATFDERIQRMKETILERAAVELGVPTHSERPLLDRIRALLNALERQQHETLADSDYARQLHTERQQHLHSLYQRLWRVLRFIVTNENYVRDAMTVERYMEILQRLEWEVFGAVRWHGPRKVLIRVGTPVNLAEYWDEYRANKRGTTAVIMARLEEDTRQRLASLGGLSTPFPATRDTDHQAPRD